MRRAIRDHCGYYHLANTRLIRVIAVLVCFALIFPVGFGAQPSLHSLYAHTCLVVMQAYVVSGLWTDSHLHWTGIIISALILISPFVFPRFFGFGWPFSAAARCSPPDSTFTLLG